MFKNPFRKRKSTEEPFWLWFQNNESRLYSFEQDQERVFDDLSDALGRVHDSLTFEFGPVLEDGRREFIVSADGNRAAFPAVQALVNAAPRLDRWITIPFRPPKSLEMTIKVGDYELGPDDVWFTAEADRGKVGLSLYIRGLADPKNPTVCLASFILLDNALGEFAVETQVGFIDRFPLPPDPLAAGLREFRHIREVVDCIVH